jgi:ERF superfamily
MESNHDTDAAERQPLLLPAESDRQMQLNPEWLIAKAIEQKLPVKTLESLLAMRERLKAERAREAYFSALSAFQAACPVIPKSKAVYNKDGRTVRYHYAPLGEIVRKVAPLLTGHGLSFRFDATFEAAPPAQVVTCTVYHLLGHSEASTFRSPIEQEAYMNEIQRSGSSLSYGKRYALCNALGIVADEDDDGVASGNEPAYSNGTKCITPAQHRLLEARIKQMGLDRERVKDWLTRASKGHIKHINDLPAELFDRFLAKLGELGAP